MRTNDMLNEKEMKRLRVLKKRIMQSISCSEMEGLPCRVDRGDVNDAMAEWLHIQNLSVK